MPQNRISIFDTTLRDGEQSPGCSMDLDEKLRMAVKLEELGVDIIEAGFPIASEGDFAAVKAVASRCRGVKVAALCRTADQDVARAAEALAYAASPRIHTFCATSDIHLEHKLKKSRAEVIDMTRRAVAQARNYADDVEFSAEDATRSDIDYLCEVLDTAVEAGASVLNVPDTVGYTTPSEFKHLVEQVRDRVVRDRDVIISVHCHNDLGLAVGNSLAAIDAGARQVECTINGIGERAGNASLEEIVMALHVRHDRLPYVTNIRTAEICATSRMLSETVGVPVPPNKAIVGANAFAHEAGIHQDGVLKNPLTYEILRPESVGAPGTRLVLGKHSGTRGVDARCRALGFFLKPDALTRVYERLVTTADRVKAIEDFHIVDAVSADRSVTQELRPCV